MKKHQTGMQACYAPQAYKCFEGALEAFFSKECPQIGGTKTRQVLVSVISEMVRRFYPETGHLEPGQIISPTVHACEKGSYGKSIKETELTTVVLDLVTSKDALDRSRGKKLREMKIEAAARLCKQAYD